MIRHNQAVEELFDHLEKIKDEFESIERPELDIESPTRRASTTSVENSNRTFYVPEQASNDKLGSVERSKVLVEAPSKESPKRSTSSTPEQSATKEVESIQIRNSKTQIPTKAAEMSSNAVAPNTLELKRDELSEFPVAKEGKTPDPGVKLLELKLELERESKEDSMEEIGGWEFDELEEELETSDIPNK